MNAEMLLTFVILAVTILVFLTDKIRVDIVAILSLLALTLTNLITPEQALSGFSNSTVVTIAALFIVGEGLLRTGVANWLGGKLLALAGNSEPRLLVLLMIGTGGLSGFLSNTGTVAVLLPVVAAAAWSIGTTPSKLLIPMAFAASLGGLLTLIGTPPNIVVTEALSNVNLPTFSFFEFSLVGLPLLGVGTAYMLLVGHRFLPARQTSERSSDVSASPEDLARMYQLEGTLFWLRVRRGSTLVGKTLQEAALGRDYNVSILRVEHTPQPTNQLPLDSLRKTHEIALPTATTAIQFDDLLLVEGTFSAVQQLATHFNLGLQPITSEQEQPSATLLSHEIGLAEILITPRSRLNGSTLADNRFAEKYNVQVLGVWRRGRTLERSATRLPSVKLQFGDALLVRGRWQDIELLQNEPRNFVVVGSPQALARQVPGLGPQAIVSLLALTGMIMLMVTGLVSTVIATMITAVVMVLGRCLTIEQAYRAINWESVILIAAMLPMSTALTVTGGAEFIAGGLVNSVGVIHPTLLLAAIFLLTMGFSQVISNTATAVLAAPIALSAAMELAVSPKAVLAAVAIGASTAFLTPIASPVNTLVMSSGGYKFVDFAKVGFPLVVLVMVIAILLIPLIWTM